MADNPEHGEDKQPDKPPAPTTTPPTTEPTPAPTTTTEEPPAWAKPLLETQKAIAETLKTLSGLVPTVNPNPTPDNPQQVRPTPAPVPAPVSEAEAAPATPKERRGLFSQGVKVRW